MRASHTIIDDAGESEGGPGEWRTAARPAATTATARHTGEDGRAWHNRDFRRLWGATAISLFGSEIGDLALPLLAIITLSADASQVGLLRSAQFLPFLVATIPLGLVVDRSARRSLMIAADLGRFVLVGSIPVLVWLGVRQIEVLYLLVFGAGTLTVLYQLADFAFLPDIVPRRELIDANGKLSAAQSANEIAGKGVGGLIVAALTAPFAVVLDAATFLMSALCLARIADPDPSSIAAVEGPSGLASALVGLSIAMRNRFIRPLLGEATTFNFFNEIFILGLLVYAVRDVGLGPALIGSVFVAGGIGSFLGAWFGTRFTSRFGYGRVLLATMLLGNTAPAAVVLLGGDRYLGLAILATIFLVMGVGIGVANMHAVSLRQIAVPEQVRGRVNAGYRLVSWGALPLGAAIGGALASTLGAHDAMVIGAVGIPLATLWVWISPIPSLRTVADASDPASGTIHG
jgi:Na+/melibiose symporter-like transporter